MKLPTKTWNNWLLIFGAIVLTIIPLVIIKDSEFRGADGKAQDLITEIEPTYQAWVTPLIEPPGNETEGLLFAIQAAIGAGTIGYVIGFYHGRNKS
jgi:cobalt/nickel transport protein